MRTQTTTKVPGSSTAWSGRPDVPLSDDTLELVDEWWRTANYLSIGQIYLLDNPLLRRPLTRDDVKPRLIGHWGTTPGLNFIYAHLNRAIVERAQTTMYITGPGHGGPGLVANAYLDGTYSEIYTDITQDERACTGCSSSSPSLVASPATWRPRPPARSTRAASSGMRFRTPTAPPLTTPTCW